MYIKNFNNKKGRNMRKLRIVMLVATIAMLSSGCVLTRIVTMPMRAVGGILTIIPVAGDAAHTAIDESADIIDKVPI